MCWELLNRIKRDFTGRLPEVKSLSAIDTKTILIRERVILSSLEEQIVSRLDDVKTGVKFGELEDDGMIYLDPIDQDKFKVKCPFPILMTCYHQNMRIANEPVLSTSKTLDPYNNELQDLSTLVSLMFYYSFRYGEKFQTDMCCLFPEVFKKSETIVELMVPIRITQLTSKVESLPDQRKLENGYYMNAEKATWGDSFINIPVIAGAHQGVTSLIIIIQSKRHRVQNNTDNISSEKYLKRLTYANSVKENEIVLYIFIRF